MHRVLATGGVSAPITELQDGEIRHSWPWFLPDGQRFLYLILGTVSEKTGLYVQTLGAKERTFVTPTQGRGAVVDGMLLFMRDNTLLAQRINLASLRLEGEANSVAEDVRRSVSDDGNNTFSVSGNGVMAYRAVATDNSQLTWYRRDGTGVGTALSPGGHFMIEMSPDDKKVAVQSQEGGTGNDRDLFLLDLMSGVFSRLTTGKGIERDPPVVARLAANYLPDRPDRHSRNRRRLRCGNDNPGRPQELLPERLEPRRQNPAPYRWRGRIRTPTRR